MCSCTTTNASALRTVVCAVRAVKYHGTVQNIVAQFRSVHSACFEQPLHEVQTTDASELVETDRTNSTQKTVSSATVLVLQSMHTVQHCVYTVVRAVRAIEYL